MARRLVASLLASVVLVAAGTAAGDPGDEKERVDGRIAELEATAGDQGRRAGVLTEELSAVAGRVRDLEAGVRGQQARLSVLEGSVARAQARLAALDRTIARQTTVLKRLQRQYRIALARLMAHVRAIYVSDDPDVIGVVLGARSFSELIDSVEFLSRVNKQDHAIARDVGEARDRLVAARRATRAARAEAAVLEQRVSAQAAEQRALVGRLAASRDALVAAQADKRSTLASLTADRADVLAEIEALEAQSARLGAAIRAAQSQSSGTTAPPVGGSGVLQWPVSGPVTSGFGWRWGRMHEGIDIAVPTGTPVGAAGSGTVIYAGWMGGYGYLVAIDHGGGLSTAYGHNSSVSVSVGQSVEAGQTIALAGSTGHSTGPHVHFETRVNGRPVDPLTYL
jgi:murein DD-endopeptidase MepM/ murein hydrolase activator NlpD